MSTPVTECCYAAGGRVLLTLNGVQVSPRSVSIMPIPYDRTVASNQDGTIYTTFKPMPAEADITLSDSCGFTIEDVMVCPLDVTIDMIDVKRRYLFTRAVMVGRPTINTESGEIRGLKITANLPTYTNY